MRNIEYSRISSHRVVFFELRAEAERQVPAAKVDDFGALCNMGVVERSLQAHRNLAAKVDGDSARTFECLPPLCPWT